MKANVVYIKKLLDQQGLEGVLVPKSQEIPFDQLFVPMGVDEQGRELLLQIKVIEEDLSSSYQLIRDTPKQGISYHSVHFILGLPFQVKDEQVGEVSRLILLLNKSFGLPGFEFSEVDRLIYFRTVIMVAKELDELVVLATIGNLMSYVETFAQTLQDVGEGKLTLEDIVKEVTSQKNV